MPPRRPNPVVGTKFGQWVVQSDVVERCGVKSKIYVSCPHTTNALIDYGNLLQGLSTGCVQCAAEKSTPFSVEQRQEYSLFRARWKSMRMRCQNPSHKAFSYYGGRGIRVAPEFEQLSAYVEYITALPGYDIDLQIDRIDNDGHYEPGNLRWVSRSENQRNTRHNSLVDYDGRTMCAVDFQQKYTTLSYPYVLRLLREGVPPATIVNMRSSRKG